MAKHTREYRRDANRQRVEQKPWRKLYHTAAWKRMRAEQLSREPLCKRCHDRGKVVAATIAHHVDRHEGNEEKFFSSPLSSSCKACHDSTEHRIEMIGYEMGVDQAGRPVAGDHPWNLQRGPSLPSEKQK